jgi:ribosomal protein L37E
VPYRRCPRCGLSSYIPPSHAREATCPHCDMPLPKRDRAPEEEDDDDPSAAEATG